MNQTVQPGGMNTTTAAEVRNGSMTLDQSAGILSGYHNPNGNMQQQIARFKQNIATGNGRSSSNKQMSLPLAQKMPKVSEAAKLEGEEFFQQGKVLLSDKRYKEAVKAFSKCLAVDRGSVDALFYRGVTNLD